MVLVFKLVCQKRKPFVPNHKIGYNSIALKTVQQAEIWLNDQSTVIQLRFLGRRSKNLFLPFLETVSPRTRYR